MTLVTFATSIQGYRSSMAKATMVFDNELRSLTQVLANITDLHPVALATQKDAAFVYQIWQNNKLIISSQPEVNTAISAFKNEFSEKNKQIIKNNFTWEKNIEILFDKIK